jgi:hypothetical protein
MVSPAIRPLGRCAYEKRFSLIARMVVSTYLPSMYIPDRPFSLPSAPVRALQVLNGSKMEHSVKGVEAITSPNYVTGLAAALMSKVRHHAKSSTSTWHIHETTVELSGMTADSTSSYTLLLPPYPHPSFSSHYLYPPFPTLNF